MSLKEFLPVHEWIAIVSIVLLLSCLTFFVSFKDTKIVSKHSQDPYYLVSQDIEVWIEGAVLKPGNYSMKRGDSLQDLLKLAELAPDASTKSLKLDRKLRNGQRIKISKARSKKLKT